jgi:hypothetical protein
LAVTVSSQITTIFSARKFLITRVGFYFFEIFPISHNKNIQ